MTHCWKRYVRTHRKSVVNCDSISVGNYLSIIVDINSRLFKDSMFQSLGVLYSIFSLDFMISQCLYDYFTL